MFITVGKVKLDFSNYEMEQVEKNYKSLQNGGRFKPRSCIARHRVAIIIPYRNRKEHLIKLMNNLHSILQRQQLDYGIYVIEVAPMSDFNRALSLNIGFQEASREYDYQCFIFHDVDLLPENDRNMYTCPTDPRHMSVAVDRLKYKLPYATIFGGVVAMTKEHFLTVNGFSNKFFGWGGEDDDMYKRINYTHLNITRYKPKIARYRMLAHRKDSSVNTERFYLLRHTNDTWRTDGLNSLTYRHIKTDRHRLFTYVLVDIDPAHPAYYTDRLKIVDESIRKMREDFNKSKENDLSTESTGANSSLASKGVNSSRLVVARSEQNMRTLMPNQSINSTTGTLITDKPKHLGALHPIQQFMLSLKELLTDKKEEDINSISDKELASFVRVYVNNLRKAGFSINNELHFKKDTVIKTKSDTKPKLDKIVKYINANKKW
ncbi:Beta-1,4-N-acetylgalactosaminyltransferase bre-4 [Mizuhopecten yessoensis]|uniref:Beta-1,4-galactosyltransferase n=1 Tax=Mizuhopecten yessoensis TaxID=6573 RepID=A0A210Q756_MIZYE|nr:Beta-1,4-N-acetylgalactosaminyltransferase bre-4 [Mizuhopecten yessoensis]